MHRLKRNKIKQLRMSKLWTQEELAELAGVTPTTVYCWESGTIARIRNANLKRLADLFEVDWRELVLFKVTE